MSEIEFVLDTTAFRKLVLQSPEMLSLTESEAAKRAGSDEHLKSFIGFDRAKTIIYPNTKEYPS